MKKLLFLLTFNLFILLTGFTIQNDRPVRNKTKTLTKSENKLQLKELNNPLQYLTPEVMVKANLVMVKKESPFNDAQYENDGYLIEGAIKNKAHLAHFKNIIFRVNFYSTAQIKIGSKDFVLNESYKPHSTNSISFKIYPPEGYIEFDFEIVDASGV